MPAIKKKNGIFWFCKKKKTEIRLKTEKWHLWTLLHLLHKALVNLPTHRLIS